MNFYEIVIYPAIGGFLLLLGQKIVERLKTSSQSKIDQAEANGKDIDNEVKSAVFYQNLLDDAGKRINQCLEIIDNLNIKIAERDKIIENNDEKRRQLQQHIKDLMESNETLITEIKKFKQLNGKV